MLSGPATERRDMEGLTLPACCARQSCRRSGSLWKTFLPLVLASANVVLPYL